MGRQKATARLGQVAGRLSQLFREDLMPPAMRAQPLMKRL